MKEGFIPAARFHILTPSYDFFSDILGFGKSYRKKILVALSSITTITKARILDAGCGTGKLAIDMKKQYPEIELYGVDADEKILSIAKKRTEKQGLKIIYENAFLQNIPFTDNYFEVVYSSLVFHHLPREIKQKSMNEIYRVLKKDGIFFLIDFGMPKNKLDLYPLYAKLFEEGYDNYMGNLPTMLNHSKFRNIKGVTKYKHGITILSATK